MLARSFLSLISQHAAAPVDASCLPLPHHHHHHLQHRQPRLGPVRESRESPLAAQPQGYMPASFRVTVLARLHWVPATTREYLGESTRPASLGPGDCQSSADCGELPPFVIASLLPSAVDKSRLSNQSLPGTGPSSFLVLSGRPSAPFHHLALHLPF
ncbi:hypothetical protein FALCPG4_003314 [Fusarium falciforme]